MYLASFAQHNVLSFVHFIGVSVVPFYCLVIFYFVEVYHRLLMHLPIHGHLSCVQFGAIMNKASVNIHMQLLCRHVLNFLWEVPGDGSLGHTESVFKARSMFLKLSKLSLCSPLCG